MTEGSQVRVGFDLGGTKMLVGVLDADQEVLYENRERSTGQEYRFVPEGPELLESEWQACLELLETVEQLVSGAGAKIRRTGLSMLLGPLRPVIISPTNPWKVWKLSRLTTVTSTSPRSTCRRSSRVSVIGT